MFTHHYCDNRVITKKLSDHIPLSRDVFQCNIVLLQLLNYSHVVIENYTSQVTIGSTTAILTKAENSGVLFFLFCFVCCWVLLFWFGFFVVVVLWVLGVFLPLNFI